VMKLGVKALVCVVCCCCQRVLIVLLLVCVGLHSLCESCEDNSHGRQSLALCWQDKPQYGLSMAEDKFMLDVSQNQWEQLGGINQSISGDCQAGLPVGVGVNQYLAL